MAYVNKILGGDFWGFVTCIIIHNKNFVMPCKKSFTKLNKCNEVHAGLELRPCQAQIEHGQ